MLHLLLVFQQLNVNITPHAAAKLGENLAFEETTGSLNLDRAEWKYDGRINLRGWVDVLGHSAFFSSCNWPSETQSCQLAGGIQSTPRQETWLLSFLPWSLRLKYGSHLSALVSFLNTSNLWESCFLSVVALLTANMQRKSRHFDLDFFF